MVYICEDYGTSDTLFETIHLLTFIFRLSLSLLDLKTKYTRAKDIIPGFCPKEGNEYSLEIETKTPMLGRNNEVAFLEGS